MLNIERFINADLYIISDDHNRNVVIDVFNNTIECSAPGNVFPVMKLSHNSTHVIKLNKCSVSTCNIEMLVYMLSHNNDLFKAVYTYIKYTPVLIEERELYAKNNNVTLSQFYNLFNDNIPAFVEFFKAASPETRQQIILDHICFEHNAKMSGVISLSTYVGYNAFCVARCNNCDNAICKYCYAASLTNQRYHLKMKLIRIMAIFTTVELQPYDIPVLDKNIHPYFRFESFGDLNNKLQFQNYNLFARVNSGVNITIWTKNPGIIQACINSGLSLSDNLIIGLSSLYLNTPELEKARRYSFIRFLFTVYDDQYIQDNNIVINCGAKHCISCGICYKYLHEYKSGLFIINERKK